MIDLTKALILKHAYDPVYAREYYLKNRELKGRKKGSGHPQSKVTYDGRPVQIKPGQRFEEDETPNLSPSGAKLVDYNGGPDGLGKAVYADGSVFTSSGWNKKPTPNVRAQDEPQNQKTAEARAYVALGKWGSAAKRYESMPKGPAKVRAKKSLDALARRLDAELGKFQSEKATKQRQALQKQRLRLSR